MITVKLKKSILALLTIISLTSAIAGLSLFKTARADTVRVYDESYRNKFTYSPFRGWNNDPNGLVYVNGIYHLYYQYNAKAEDYENNKNEANDWGKISWGHATSTDLVNWTQQNVAIMADQNVEDKFYGMFFSGSAVYDKDNTSGLFSEGESGIVAIMTQPKWDEELKYDVQRQVLAYSTDGNDFTIYGEVLGRDNDGGLKDNEFRDPKVFWNEKLNKWLMVVGGGSVRMYSSTNLKDWEYIGETGFWGECPDISEFTVDGVKKHVLIISPEDKDKSYEYNKTNRLDAYFPAEYYVVGDINEKGLFISTQKLQRLSEGIDSYAFQSFNNSPDGKVYGISWSASWLTVGEYKGLRKNYNGGLGVVCELELKKEGNEYLLNRYPVKNYENLRGEVVKSFENEQLKGGQKLFGDITLREGDIELTADFIGNKAKYFDFSLRVSQSEKVVINYDVSTQMLTLDRSNSSLIAKKHKVFKDKYTTKVPLIDNKLTLRVLLDRAFISLFANGGRASFFSAIFPSAISDKVEFMSDGDIKLSAKIYKLNSIFNYQNSSELLATTNKIDGVVGNTYQVIYSSYSDTFDIGGVTCGVLEGTENVSVKKMTDGTINIKILKAGFSKVRLKYGDTINDCDIEIYCYEKGFTSTVNFSENYRSFSYISANGLELIAGGDGFIFSETQVKNFSYSATFTPKNDKAKAGGLVFGNVGNPSGYYFVTVDVKENKVKLVEFKGEKEGSPLLAVSKCNIEANSYKLCVNVVDNEVKVYLDDNIYPILIYKLDRYIGGRVGLNVFDSEMTINNVTLKELNNINSNIIEGEVIKVVNVTDKSQVLEENDYAIENGKLIITNDYLHTLENSFEYIFRVITTKGEYDISVMTDFTPVGLIPLKDEYFRGDDLRISVNNAEVYKLFIDGKEYSFKKDDNVITVSREDIINLIRGSHVIQVYTSKGRPKIEITIAGLEDYREEEIIPITHTFFYIDIAMFGVMILTYFAFGIVKKYREKKYR